ncbi:hypothetical protein [Streptomyces sp. SID9727]|uniref:hypothetical protein n=1 Tax=Streptomyces sp. SID9727 TaxID=2706114 RepID=UPI0013CD26AD|nr:hypothetical protein [Streptomyces sp. SID9727]NEC65165.1 hypothetical protein [Streptomyces sp. SID9727]
MPINFSSSATERPVPPWALRLARALPFVVLPHCLWRLPFAFGFTMGMVGLPKEPEPWWSPAYVLGLSVFTEALALLCMGLVSGWGERVPDRVPVIGGRRVPPLAATVPATLGGLGLVALWDTMPLAWFGLFGFHEVGFSNGWWMALARVCISPVMLWGPIVLALAYAYHRRRGAA